MEKIGLVLEGGAVSALSQWPEAPSRRVVRHGGRGRV